MVILLPSCSRPPRPPARSPWPPYRQSNANAGATPFAGAAMWRAFHGQAVVPRIVDHTVSRAEADPRLADILKGQDLARLRRLLKEQFCYILNGGCAYTGRDMAAAHKDIGLQTADRGALVEELRTAMGREGVGFAAQNRLLAKLAPMKRVIVRR